MNDQKFMDNLFNQVPLEDSRFVRLSMDFVERVHDILEQKGLSQRDLAKLLGKQESEISQWLSVGHNMTLKSIAKVEIALETIIMVTPNRIQKEMQKDLEKT